MTKSQTLTIISWERKNPLLWCTGWDSLKPCNLLSFIDDGHAVVYTSSTQSLSRVWSLWTDFSAKVSFAFKSCKVVVHANHKIFSDVWYVHTSILVFHYFVNCLGNFKGRNIFFVKHQETLENAETTTNFCSHALKVCRFGDIVFWLDCIKKPWKIKVFRNTYPQRVVEPESGRLYGGSLYRLL